MLDQPLPPALNLDTIQGFEGLQRVSKLFAASSLVPDAFRNNIPNTFIGVELAVRIGAAPLQVLQNLYVIHGRPAWASQFLVALFNSTKRFSAIKYVFDGEKGTPSYSCHAECVELATEERIIGPTVTMDMAQKEGWSTKPGSKWKTMPDLMLRYRAAAFLIRTTAPEVGFGLYTADELRDVFDKPAPQSVQPEPMPPVQEVVVVEEQPAEKTEEPKAEE